MSGMAGSNLKARIEGIIRGRPLLRLNITKKTILGLAAVTAFLVPIAVGVLHPLRAQTQNQAALPQFEVAAIRRNVDAGPGRIGVSPGGRMTIERMPVRFFIRFAYGVQDFQISGGPSWMNTDDYDVIAKASENVVLQQIRPYLQRLLEDRFKLVVHHETKDVPAYELLPAKGGLKVLPSKDENCVSPDPKLLKPGTIPHFCGNIGVRRNLIEAYAVPMDRFVSTLSIVLGRTVIDKTGIKYNIDVHLEFTPNEINGSLSPAPGDPVPPPSATDLSKPSIFTAVEEQLGLKLESSKAPGDVLVVDQLERPSEN